MNFLKLHDMFYETTVLRRLKQGSHLSVFSKDTKGLYPINEYPV